jgi:hypothetical protein
MNFEQPETPQDLKEKYRAKANKDGFLSTAEFATQELRRQNKSIAGFLDEESEYFLGEGLRLTCDAGNYEASIHIDDLEEFIVRVRDHYGE